MSYHPFSLVMSVESEFIKISVGPKILTTSVWVLKDVVSVSIR